MKPQKGTYPSYYENYIPLVKEDNVLEALSKNWNDAKSLLADIPRDKENYAYAEKKWTVKQLINHMIDAERIFAYRALRFARKDPQQPLPFEEDDYAKNAEVQHRNVADLLHEFETVRKATLSLYNSLNDETMMLSGKTFAGEVSVLAIGFVIAGHATHHLSILQERYLKNKS